MTLSIGRYQVYRPNDLIAAEPAEPRLFHYSTIARISTKSNKSENHIIMLILMAISKVGPECPIADFPVAQIVRATHPAT
jgi:hypothetical protein